MPQTLIIARMLPGSEAEVRRIFAESDGTSLPHQLGVRRRSLFSFGDVYLHLMDMTQDAQRSLRSAADIPAFRQIGEDLKSYIQPYQPETWRSPLDAVAAEFYQWNAHPEGES